MAEFTGIEIADAENIQIDAPIIISRLWEWADQRITLIGPTHVIPSGEYITTEDVASAAFAQGTLGTTDGIDIEVFSLTQ